MLPITRFAAAALSLGLVIGACSDSGGSVTTTTQAESTTTAETTTTVAETTTVPAPTVEEEIEATYFAHWKAYVEILAETNPNNPLIDQYFTGASKQALLDFIARKLIDGTTTRLPDDPADFTHTVLGIDLEGNEAKLVSCIVDGLVIVDRATGAIVNDTVETVRWTATMVLSDGHWKVSTAQSEVLGEGRLPCGA